MKVQKELKFICKRCSCSRKTQDSLRFHILQDHLLELTGDPEFDEFYLRGPADPQKLFCFRNLVRKLTKVVEL